MHTGSIGAEICEEVYILRDMIKLCSESIFYEK